MKRFAVAFGVMAGAVAGLAGQSKPLQPAFVVRLAAPADTRSGAGEARAPGMLWTGTTNVQEPARPLLLPLPVTRLDEPGASATLDAGRPLSLRFSTPMPIRDVLLLLVRDTGLSLVTEPGVEGRFVGELTGVTLRRALDLVLTPQGLDYEVTGTAIRVFKRRMETRFIDVDVNAVGSRPVESSGGVYEDVTAGARALLSPEGRVAFDRKAGVVQVTDYPERLDRIALYFESVERRLRRQVDIQARVVEVMLFDSTALSVNWSAAVEKARVTTSGGTATVDFGALVSALREQGTVTVLASTDVKALHNEPAMLRIGTEEVVFVKDGDQSRTHTLLDGVSLAVTPRLTADGTVLMTVAPTVTTRDDRGRNGKGQVPPMAVSQITTAVRLRDGETLVLPGIRRERDRNGTPARGFSALFKRQPAPAKTYAEIAVLLTPRVN